MEFLLIAGGAVLGWLGSWFSDIRARKRADEDRRAAKQEADAGRRHEREMRERQSQEARLVRSEAHARDRVTELLEEYLTEIGARANHKMSGEDGRGEWSKNLSSHIATASLIPDKKVREDLEIVVDFIGQLAGDFHAVHLLNADGTYESTIYEALLVGRDVSAEWLRAGKLTRPTRVHVKSLRDRLYAAPAESGPAAAGAPDRATS